MHKYDPKAFWVISLEAFDHEFYRAVVLFGTSP